MTYSFRMCGCSKLEEYYCIGCYCKYSLTTETYFTRTLWCWGLGYLWEKNLSDPNVKPRSSYDFAESGASCFTGICCIQCGDNTDLFYDHEKERNICNAYEIYSPCGVCSRNEGLGNTTEINVKTPCCGFKKNIPKHSISGASKTIVPVLE